MVKLLVEMLEPYRGRAFDPGCGSSVEIFIAAQKPAGVPDENWLPINREDQGLDLMLRVYAPDLEKMKTWKGPNAVLVK